MFVAVVRYLSIEAWNRPALALKKGQSVSVDKETNDGGDDIYVYGDVDVDVALTISFVSLRHPSMVTAIDYPPDNVRVREVLSVPLIVISDSKLHDTYFVSYFLSETLLGKTGW